MTPDERQLITGLFDRMRANGVVDKDREAESLINQAVRQIPDSAYVLVQSVLAQEHYLQEAAARIQELEDRERELEDELARMQQAQSAPQRGGSFLGGLFGGSQAAQPQAPAARSGSVPSFGGARSQAPRYGEPGSPWGQQSAQGSSGSAWGQQGGNNQVAPQQQPAQSGSPGFMRSALTTAAGVAGGMLAANAISGMLRGDSHANAAGHPSSQSSGAGSSPYEVNNPADQQRQLDEQQDMAQDAEMDQEEQVAYDDSDDSSGWGSDDVEI